MCRVFFFEVANTQYRIFTLTLSSVSCGAAVQPDTGGCSCAVGRPPSFHLQKGSWWRSLRCCSRSWCGPSGPQLSVRLPNPCLTETWIRQASRLRPFSARNLYFSSLSDLLQSQKRYLVWIISSEGNLPFVFSCLDIFSLLFCSSRIPSSRQICLE